MSRSSITISELFREYDLWNGDVSPCTKAAVGVAVRSLRAFLVWQYEQEQDVAPPADLDPELAAITQRDISHWRAWLALGTRDGRGGWQRKPVSAHTVHSYHAGLRQLFRYGLELEPPLIASDPTAGLKNPRPAEIEPDVWSRDELADLLRAIRKIRWRDPTARTRWTSLLYSLLHGQRINEATNLRRIDLRPQDWLVLVRARDDCPGQWWQWRSKGKTDRAIGASRQYARCLRRLLRECPWMYPHLPRRACAHRIGRIGNLTWRQRQQPYCVVNRDFDAIVAEANVIRLEKGQPTIAVAYPHMGRQTAATALAARGVHPKVLMTIMGWSSAETGNRHYIKVQQSQAVAVGRECFTHTGGRQLGIKDSNLD